MEKLGSFDSFKRENLMGEGTNWREWDVLGIEAEMKENYEKMRSDGGTSGGENGVFDGEKVFDGENSEEVKRGGAKNIAEVRRDFFQGGEIMPSREADAFLRVAVPVEAYEDDVSDNGGFSDLSIKGYDEVMKVEAEPGDTTTRFLVDGSEFPLFSRQMETRRDESTGFEVRDVRLNVNDTLGRYIEGAGVMIGEIEKADAVIYLDKSARPVSWLVNEFYEEFSDEERKPEGFLAIDRIKWLREVGLDPDENGKIIGENGEKRDAKFKDFERLSWKIPKEKIAGLRALFVPGGVSSENTEEIMETETGLEGKEILVVDEIQRTGTTAEIAQWFLKKAIPEAKSVKILYFWKPASVALPNGERQMGKEVFWYDHDKHDAWSGRGVWDINTGYYVGKYEENPNNYTRAQKMGAEMLGEPMDVTTEYGKPSLRLQGEIRKLHEAYREGKVLTGCPYEATEDVQDKMMERMEKLGVEYAPESEPFNREKDKNKYNVLKKKFKV